MDLWTIAGIAMLVIWAVGTFAFAAPGWIHLLLSVGVFVIIWRIVMRGTRNVPTQAAAAPGDTPMLAKRSTSGR